MTFFLLSNPFTAPFRALLLYLAEQFAQLPLPGWLSPYAISIVIMAALISLATQPLLARQRKSGREMQAKMQVLQPKLKELERKYKDDREKLSRAQMELYREHDFNPLSGFAGCLPMIVQMVVVIGLYRAITLLAGTSAAPGPMAGQQFLWVPNLAACEPSPLCGKETAILPVAIPILLITMTAAQFAYQRLMTPPTQSSDPTQQTMAQTMKWMPLMFAWIFLKLPAGVLLYYAATTLFGVCLMGVWNRLQPLEPVAQPAERTSTTTVTDDVTDAREEQRSDEGTAAGRRRRRKKGR